MQDVAYYIRRWDDSGFVKSGQNDRASRNSRMPWIAIPTKHDGKGFLRLSAKDPDGAVYGIWILLLAVAGNCTARGVLADEDGPLSVEDIALRIRRNPEAVRRAIEILSCEEIKWIGQQPASELPALGWANRTGQDRTLRDCPESESESEGAGDRRGGDSAREDVRRDSGPRENAQGDSSRDISPQDDSNHATKTKRNRSDSVRRGARPSIIKQLTEDLLKDDARLRKWFDWQASSPDSAKPFFYPGEWELCLRVRDHCVEHGKPPVALFIHLGKGRTYDTIVAVKSSRK